MLQLFFFIFIFIFFQLFWIDRALMSICSSPRETMNHLQGKESIQSVRILICYSERTDTENIPMNLLEGQKKCLKCVIFVHSLHINLCLKVGKQQRKLVLAIQSLCKNYWPAWTTLHSFMLSPCPPPLPLW